MDYDFDRLEEQWLADIRGKAFDSVKSESAQDKTAAILDDRKKTHGTFRQVAEIAQLFKNVVRDETTALDASQQEAIDMIASKLARICSGNPDEPDHWRDIAGYATLVAEELVGGGG